MAQQATVTVTWDGVEGVGPVDFAYLEEGPADGPLALCLHGFPDHAPTWSALLTDLAASYFFQLPLADMAVSANDYALIEKLWRDWSPGYEPPADYLRGIKDILAAPGGLDAAIGYYRHLLNPLKHDKRLAAVESAASGYVPVPTLYLHGADDGCIGTDMVDADGMKNLFPSGLEIEILPGVGHFLHLENPATVNGRIVEFLTAAS